MTLQGILAYGFDLGGESGWKIRGVQDYEPWRPSWIEHEESLEISAGTFDYETAIVEQLAERGVEGVEVVRYGVLDSDTSGLLLTSWHVCATGPRVLNIYLPDVATRADIERWDDMLVRALKVLDIRLHQPNPLIMLTQSYG